MGPVKSERNTNILYLQQNDESTMTIEEPEKLTIKK